MATKSDGTVIKLDWSRLLGFDQAQQNVDEARSGTLNDPRVVKLGGGKIGAGKLGGRRPALADVKSAR